MRIRQFPPLARTRKDGFDRFPVDAGPGGILRRELSEPKGIGSRGRYLKPKNLSAERSSVY